AEGTREVAREVALVDWADEILRECAPIAAALDACFGGSEHARVLADARAALADPDRLPSARVLATIRRDFGGSYTGFIRAQAEQTRNMLLAVPWHPAQQAAFEDLARRSVAEQRAIEAADTVDFETWRQAYLAPERLLA
ncbi:MAG: glutamate--cysteine ligase, partial [Rubrivivax sp.]|nr:glutamate--cysteine ligase [Rubrivivax sp.]